MLIENATRTGLDGDFCNAWKTRYRLTNRVLMDPQKTILRLFTGGRTGSVTVSLPSMALFDAQGKIVYVGSGQNLTQMAARIDNILAGP